MDATVYRLGSDPMVSAPGLVAWAKHGYAFDQEPMVNVIVQGWPGVTPAAAHSLLSGRASYAIEGETVVFNFEPGAEILQ